MKTEAGDVPSPRGRHGSRTRSDVLHATHISEHARSNPSIFHFSPMTLWADFVLEICFPLYLPISKWQERNLNHQWRRNLVHTDTVLIQAWAMAVNQNKTGTFFFSNREIARFKFTLSPLTVPASLRSFIRVWSVKILSWTILHATMLSRLVSEFVFIRNGSPLQLTQHEYTKHIVWVCVRVFP